MTTHSPSIVIAAATQVERTGWAPVPPPAEWGKHPVPGHLYARWYFDNGYGVNVFAGADFVEVAVLRFSYNEWVLDMSTPVTDDVEFVYSEGELVDFLTRVAAL